MRVPPEGGSRCEGKDMAEQETLPRHPGDDDDQDPGRWRDLGCVRADCEPHRGGLLTLLAIGSLVFAVLSLLVCVPGLVGLALGILASVMAGRDLDEMRNGLMD